LSVSTIGVVNTEK